MTYARDATPPFYHGTRAALGVGDLLVPGHGSNYQEQQLSWIYFSASLDAAIWGCELAKGDAPERIYIVEPTGPFEDDPNLTDKRFPGNPTASYRSRDPLRITGEVAEWEPHPPERLQEMKDFLTRLAAEGDMRINRLIHFGPGCAFLIGFHLSYAGNERLTRTPARSRE